MSGINDQVIEDGIFEDVKPACVALVPLTPPAQRVSKLPLSRADPTFLTQLLASAEQAPQARALRRATSADARLAYGAPRTQRAGIGFRTRQII